MAINLIRNSRVFFTTNLDGNNRVRVGTAAGSNLYSSSYAFSATNTYEIQVLEGMSFSQSTAQDTVTLNEAGATPARGQRSFNTSLQPADFTFSTYIRPFKNPNSSPANLIQCEEKYLWNAFSSATATSAATTTGAGWQESTTQAQVTFANSDKHQLQAFGLIIVFSDGAYVIDNCALDTATVDFGLDAIGAIQWAGKGTQVRALENFSIDPALSTPTFIGTDVNSSAVTETVTVTFATIANSATAVVGGLTFTNTSGSTLTATQAATVFANIAPGATSTSYGASFGTFSGTFGQFSGGSVSGGSSNQVAFTANVPYANVTDLTASAAATAGTPTQGTSGSPTTNVAAAKNTYAKYIANKLSTLAIQQAGSTGSQAYSVALTGGSITLSNNLTYLTPANLGTVNLPITYFTGTRSVTGTITAYLKTGLDASNVPQSAKMLKSLLDNSATAIDPQYAITVSLGGSSATTKVDFALPSAMLQIPAINTEQVISTTINFTGQGSTNNAFDITKNNELTITYSAAA